MYLFYVGINSEGLWPLRLGREWGVRREADWIPLVHNPLPQNPCLSSGILVWIRGLDWALREEEEEMGLDLAAFLVGMGVMRCSWRNLAGNELAK